MAEFLLEGRLRSRTSISSPPSRPPGPSVSLLSPPHFTTNPQSCTTSAISSPANESFRVPSSRRPCARYGSVWCDPQHAHAYITSIYEADDEHIERMLAAGQVVYFPTPFPHPSSGRTAPVYFTNVGRKLPGGMTINCPLWPACNLEFICTTQLHRHVRQSHPQYQYTCTDQQFTRNPVKQAGNHTEHLTSTWHNIVGEDHEATLGNLRLDGELRGPHER